MMKMNVIYKIKRISLFKLLYYIINRVHRRDHRLPNHAI